MLPNSLKLRTRNLYLRATSSIRKRALNKNQFTIISNNCWGGLVYESYNLPKQSPTIGMFFMADEYIKFLQKLSYYIYECQLSFIEPEDAKYKEFYKLDKRFGTYPIALLGDVEIAMLHYHSKNEAKEKWKRRCDRINWEHMLIKMNDQNNCTKDDLFNFMELPYKNKLFFTVRQEWEGIQGVTKLKSKNELYCGLFDEPFGKLNVFDLIV